MAFLDAVGERDAEDDEEGGAGESGSMNKDAFTELERVLLPSLRRHMDIQSADAHGGGASKSRQKKAVGRVRQRGQNLAPAETMSGSRMMLTLLVEGLRYSGRAVRCGALLEALEHRGAPPVGFVAEKTGRRVWWLFASDEGETLAVSWTPEAFPAGQTPLTLGQELYSVVTRDYWSRHASRDWAYLDLRPFRMRDATVRDAVRSFRMAVEVKGPEAAGGGGGGRGAEFRLGRRGATFGPGRQGDAGLINLDRHTSQVRERSLAARMQQESLRHGGKWFMEQGRGALQTLSLRQREAEATTQEARDSLQAEVVGEADKRAAAFLRHLGLSEEDSLEDLEALGGDFTRWKEQIKSYFQSLKEDESRTHALYRLYRLRLDAPSSRWVADVEGVLGEIVWL